MNSPTASSMLKIMLAQLNPHLGDLVANAAELLDIWHDATKAGADIVVASELFLCGYPPEDLIHKRAFVSQVMAQISRIVEATNEGGAALIFGAPFAQLDDMRPYNSVIIADGGKMEVRHKVHLPNYGVFDEARLFAPAPNLPEPVEIRGIKIGVPICEDIWFDDVVEQLAARGSQLLLVVNGSPFERDKPAQRLTHAQERAQEARLPLVYVNQFGGQDELVFDGASFVLDANGAVIYTAPTWARDVALTQWEARGGKYICTAAPPSHERADLLCDIYHAAMLALRDYVNKNGFESVLLGLSGGIDSAICAALAADALGHERVRCLMLPSQFTAQTSLDDAASCAKALNLQYDVVPILDAVATLEATLAPHFDDLPRDVTEENLQARIRGVILMAFSNKFGAMLVTTGNKSEVSVGYATLYGDMNGGFNPIKDIYKTDIFALARWRNAHHPHGALGAAGVVIPESIITKPPSAELRPEQTDQDSLPPYDTLDAILYQLIEEEQDVATIVAQGYESNLVEKIEHLVYVSEYKRRQAAPGPKIGKRNFGRDRRYPITHRFRSHHIETD